MLGSIGKQSGKSVESVLCICLCMLCISLRAYLRNCMSDLHQFFRACYLWLWLDPTLRYAII